MRSGFRRTSGRLVTQQLWWEWITQRGSSSNTVFVHVCICVKACSNHKTREGCAVAPNFCLTFFLNASSIIRNDVNVILRSCPMESSKGCSTDGESCGANAFRTPAVLLMLSLLFALIQAESPGSSWEPKCLSGH